jgi:hypothetical protein
MSEESPLKLGNFVVRKMKSGWLLENGDPDRYGRDGTVRSSAMHAFTTWADMLDWIEQQWKESD